MKMEGLALLLILALAAALRLTHNADNPGWYTDEGTHLAIAQNLAQGRVQYLAVKDSTLLFAKLPLFELLLAGLLRLGGTGMTTLRTLTGVLGVLTVGTLYGVVRAMTKDAALALLAALILALYPQAVLYSRFGFSYNLLAPLVLLVYLGLWRYLDAPAVDPARRRGLALAALAIGVGGVSDLWMFALLAPLLAVVALRRGRDAPWSAALALLPFGLYAAWMLLHAPQAFLFDLGFTRARLTGTPLLAQVKTLALNYTVLLTQDPWAALALIGLFLLRPARLRDLSLVLLLAPIALLGRTEALFNLSAYYTIPLLPLISLGAAVTLRHGLPYAWHALQSALHSAQLRRLCCWDRAARPLSHAGAALLLLALAGTPLLTILVHTIHQARDGYHTVIDPFLVNPGDAKQAAAYVNARTAPDEGVIASPAVAWLLTAQAADFQMSVAAGGQATPHLPADLPAARFAFDPDYRRARFVIVDNLWYTWAVWNVAGVRDMLDALAEWEVVFESGAVQVYENPDIP